MYAIKEAVIAKEHSKQPLDTAIFFMDMRTYGKEFDKYYIRAEEEIGVRFVRSRVHSVDRVVGSEDLEITYTTEDGKIETETFDMVVLSVGMETPATNMAWLRSLALRWTKTSLSLPHPLHRWLPRDRGFLSVALSAAPKTFPIR
jgi:heterodisulfide reductase subunit A